MPFEKTSWYHFNGQRVKYKPIYIDCIFANGSRVRLIHQLFYKYDIRFQPPNWTGTSLMERVSIKAAHMIYIFTSHTHGKPWMGTLLLLFLIKVAHIHYLRRRLSGLLIWEGCTRLVTSPLRTGLVKTWTITIGYGSIIIERSYYFLCNLPPCPVSHLQSQVAISLWYRHVKLHNWLAEHFKVVIWR